MIVVPNFAIIVERVGKAPIVSSGMGIVYLLVHIKSSIEKTNPPLADAAPDIAVVEVGGAWSQQVLDLPETYEREEEEPRTSSSSSSSSRNPGVHRGKTRSLCIDGKRYSGCTDNPGPPRTS